MDSTAYPKHLWRWRVTDPARPARRYLTRHHMSEAEALEMDPTAERDPGTLRVIEAPAGHHTSSGHGRIS